MDDKKEEIDKSKYALSERDIQIGIDDFFTQMLIEARRTKNTARSLSDLSSESPKVSYLIGQPGAGKSTIQKKIENEYKQNNQCAVEVNSDKVATFHRDYAELLKLLPDQCYTLSREFVRPATNVIMNKIREKKINVIIETPLNKGEKDYDTMQKFKDNGYQVELNIVAVDKYQSFYGCIKRDLLLLEVGQNPRPVAKMNHDRMYDPFLHEIMEMQKRGLCDNIRVFGRKDDQIASFEKVWETGNNNYSSAQEAVISTRAKERSRIMSDPKKYLGKLDDAKNQIELLVTDEKMKENYLTEINSLEKEFFNELSFEKSK